MFKSRRPDHPPDKLLEVVDLATGYPSGQVLFDVSLEVRHGEVVGLLGRNGMGKTTTLLTIMGRLRTWRGSIHFDARRIDGEQPARIAGLGIGLVPEGRQVFANLSVRENLLVAARPPRADGPGWALDDVLGLFPRLSERFGQAADRLSGGEQQMLAIGRALMTNPRLLILDEATEGLAPLVRRDIWTVLGELKSRGQSILIVDKNVRALAPLADRFYILEKGRVTWVGPPADLLADQESLHARLGV